MAPEQFNSNPTTSSEVYSFGIIIWELFSHQIPYPEAYNDGQIAIHKLNSEYKFRFPQNTPPLLKSLSEKCLNSNPDNRPSIEGVLHELEELFPNPTN